MKPIFDIYFWKYLFEKTPEDYMYTFRDKISRFICRWNFHPCGSIYYNPGGCEPDGHCKHCGDLIE
jgi:hypothetical protein